MGVNHSTTNQTFTNTVSNELSNSSEASATSQCVASVGDINVTAGCHVDVKNKCMSQASATIDSSVSAFMKTLNKMNEKQKADALGGFNISKTDTNVSQTLTNKLNNDCKANSTTLNEIIAHNITCSGGGSEVTLINTGSAEGNCAIKAIQRVLSDVDNKFVQDQENKGLISDITSLFSTPASSMASLAILVLAIVAMVVFFSVGTGGGGPPMGPGFAGGGMRRIAHGLSRC